MKIFRIKFWERVLILDTKSVIQERKNYKLDFIKIKNFDL